MPAIERILEERVVAVLRRQPVEVVGELVAGGIRIVEVTMDSEDAAAVVERLRGRGDVTVLAGTVRTLQDAERAVAAGAEACVAPATSSETVSWCLERGVPVVPGALTPTEVEAAWRLGVPLVKLFPGMPLGPAYVRSLLAPLADVRLLVTGGVDAGNAAEFLDAGAVAVGASLRSEAEARALVEAVRFAHA